MKVKFTELDRKHHIGTYVMVEAVAESKLTEKVVAACTEEDTYDVILTINGIEVNFLAFCERMKEQFDEQVKNKAKELIDTKLTNVANFFDELQQSAMSRASEVIDKEDIKWLAEEYGETT